MLKKKQWLFNAILLLAAFTITMAAAATGAYIQDGYQINVDEVSPQRFRASVTVENKVATERNRQAAQEAADRLDPITTRDEAAMTEMTESLEKFFTAAAQLRKEHVLIFTPYTEPDAEQAGGSADGQAEPTPEPTPAPAPKLQGLTEAATNVLLSMDSERYAEFMDDVFGVAAKVMDNGVQEVDARALFAVRDEMDKLDLNSDLRSLGYDIITLYMRPNIIVDEEATALARAERAGKFEKVYYKSGQMIVDEDQIINEEAYTALVELGLVKTDYLTNLVPILGVGLLTAIIFAIMTLYMYFFYDKSVMSSREAVLMFTLYTMVVISARALVNQPVQLLPLTIFTILAVMFLGARTAAVVNLGATIICMLILRGDVDFLVFYTLSGTAVALIAGFTIDRSRIFLAALTTSFVNLALYTGIALLLRQHYSIELLYNSVFAAMAGLLSVIISFGSMPFWEVAFGLVTPIKLLDLTNPDSKLLRRLAIEAPGTYHHSVIVANLAETAAYDIGANMSLARTGGYYHDIGKLKYPQYFAENMIGTNPHESMDAYSSVQVILSHVSYGLELAETNRLPNVIRDIIAQHHGSTILKYFYHKVRTEDPDGDYDEKDYRYPYSIPQSKEAAVVMLADTVEAAVRSMIPTGKTMDEVQKFTTELVRDKLDDGQLQDSTLTIRDLDTIVKSFMRVFRGMYHERIPYPTADKTEEAK